jgi:hypothetical protein
MYIENRHDPSQIYHSPFPQVTISPASAKPQPGISKRDYSGYRSETIETIERKCIGERGGSSLL